MSTEDIQYVLKKIHDEVASQLDTRTTEELIPITTSAFAERYMQDINNQQMLPQSIFRIFLQKARVVTLDVEEICREILAYVKTIMEGMEVIADSEIDHMWFSNN